MCFPDCGEPHSVLKVCMLLLIVSNTLCENLKCNPCDKGYFIKRNCSETSDGWLGTQCQPCSKCDGEGQIILANCTRDSGTLCGCKYGYAQTSNSSEDGNVDESNFSCKKVIKTMTTTVTPKMKPRRIRIMGTVAVLIVLAVAVLIGSLVSFKPGGKLLKNANSDII
ncbi:hypothetical protein AALO_G00140920 [Alosa alosa]|uniref:TNFR-Cys domain-containing protein n=1 Tax=Alosa alosa TaxID=278164 RepID=A0AAV6GMK9_9TELE|nr:hypothetical protein AALO_G00140920 [Alosa alosa]